MKKKRVLHFFGCMNRGGAETLIINLYNHINRDAIQFDFVVQCNYKGEYDDLIESFGGRIFKLPTHKNLNLYIKELKKILINHGPYEVCHSHVFFFSGLNLLIAKKCGVPIRIAHSHTVNVGQNNTIIRSLYHNLMRLLIKKNATIMLGCSNEACFSLYGKNYFKDKRVAVFKNAIDTDKFTSIQNYSIQNELGLSTDTKIVGHVGRFTSAKNHEKIIKVFVELLKLNDQIHLVLVGEGETKEQIVTMCKQHHIDGKIHFLGVRNDIPRLMKGFDAFLFPSHFEGLGLVLIEAQATGTPCLVSAQIPDEADLGLGLFKKVSLQESDKSWAEKLYKLFYHPKIDEENIVISLESSGYGIDTSVKDLMKYYKAGD